MANGCFDSMRGVAGLLTAKPVPSGTGFALTLRGTRHEGGCFTRSFKYDISFYYSYVNTYARFL
ncbi:MAG: hypothetical protein MJE68_12690 [Proteobacteria bacterium]|nr:hypothetical protein [Pseudomonadota bacterium]